MLCLCSHIHKHKIRVGFVLGYHFKAFGCIDAHLFRLLLSYRENRSVNITPKYKSLLDRYLHIVKEDC